MFGLARLARVAFSGGDLAPVGQWLLERTATNPGDANAWMDLSLVSQLAGAREAGLAMQDQALAIRRLFRLTPDAVQEGDGAGLRVLVLLSPGDLSENNILEFLLEETDVELDMLYVTPDQPVGPPAQRYDAAIVAVAESDGNRPLLDHIARSVVMWPVPVLNRADRIAQLARESAAALIGSAPGLVVPHTARLGRQTLAELGDGSIAISDYIPDSAFPVLARPVASHQGRGLAKLCDPSAVAAYLAAQPESEFHVVPFIDYRGTDGQFRKYRVVFIAGRPFLCHLAISDHYIVHYMSAGMGESAEKRAEEAQAMATFDDSFAHRHRSALRAVAERVGLEYFGIDCSETPDGDLLVFELDSSMTVHAMDPVDIYPYKQDQMRKVFAAFRAMLMERAEA